MSVYELNPIRDPRWAEFVERDPHASVFHTPGWLEALRRTYGYQPVVLTTSPPAAELTNGIVFCRIDSRLTGHRMVSLPFSDHCDPLVDRRDDFKALMSSLEEAVKKGRWNYIELRLTNSDCINHLNLESTNTFYFHKLDLRGDPDALFRRFHKSCVQRKIRRAEREDLTCEQGTSESLLDGFYRLFLKSRRRQKLAPPPIDWFRNLIHSLGEKAKIRIALKDGRPIAGMLVLSHKQSIVYKYGCSDPKHNNLGGMAFLFWQAILEAKSGGFSEFDFGRTDCDNLGLLAFKDRWGTARSKLTYVRYGKKDLDGTALGWTMRLGREMFPRLPDSLLAAVGKLLYPHIG